MATAKDAPLDRFDRAATWESFRETIESFYDKGWTDGLPVIPPTEDAVAEMMAAVDRDPAEVIGIVPPRQGVATIESVAANAVMAGCKPAYFPVVVAAVEAMLDERLNINGVQATTNACAPLTIVSGPIVEELGINAGSNVFGHGYRANATIGRAVRLTLVILGGGYPETGDKSPLGMPGKFTFCIGESPSSPWSPLHAERGFGEHESGVTVMAVDAPRAFMTPEDLDPVASLEAIAVEVTHITHNVHHAGEYLLVLNPLVARSLADHGWERGDIRYHLYENARVPMEEFRRMQERRGVTNPGNKARWPKWLESAGAETRVPAIRRVDDLVITVAGGTQLTWNALLGGWGNFGGWAVTRPVSG